jgi:hypothetical protein
MIDLADAIVTISPRRRLIGDGSSTPHANFNLASKQTTMS